MEGKQATSRLRAQKGLITVPPGKGNRQSQRLVSVVNEGDYNHGRISTSSAKRQLHHHC